jgi:hypothetical protein
MFDPETAMKPIPVAFLVPILLIGTGCGGNGTDPLPPEPFLFDLAFINATGNAEFAPITTSGVTGHVYGRKFVQGVNARNHFVWLVAEDLVPARPDFDKMVVINLVGPRLQVEDIFQVRFADDLPADTGIGYVSIYESPFNPTEIEFPEYRWRGISGTVTIEALQGSVLRLRLANVVLRGSELAEGTVDLNGVIEVDYNQVPDEDPDHDPDGE